MSLLIVKSNNAVIDRVIVVHQREPTENTIMLNFCMAQHTDKYDLMRLLIFSEITLLIFFRN